MAQSTDYREELRQAVKSFGLGQSSSVFVPGAALPRHVNVYLFGPQGSGKTSFIRTCFRALHGPRLLERGLEQIEQSLHRSDDGTSLYSVYPLTDRICLHDTRGQREYTAEELNQLRLVLEGRARPNTLVQQRRRYWLLLREFWRSEEQMKRTFSRTVMINKATLDTEPHFAFLVLDPNQQELLLEDADFRECYGSLISDFSNRSVPHALLCTHGDTLTAGLRNRLLHLPEKLGCGFPKVPDFPSSQQGPGGVLRPNSGERGMPNQYQLRRPSPSVAPPPPPPAPSPFEQDWKPGPPASQSHPHGFTQAAEPLKPQQRMPDIMRIVTNYLGPNDPRRRDPHGMQMQGRNGVELDIDGNDVQQDIHTLLVLLDALQQAENQVMQRVAGSRPAPMTSQAEAGCPVL